MVDKDRVEAAVAAVAGSRASVRVEGARAGIVLDATGLDTDERDRLEEAVRHEIRNGIHVH